MAQNFNWGDLVQAAKDAGFESADTIAVGDYPVECVKAEGTQSKQGADMIKAQFKVMSGPHTGHILPPFYFVPNAGNEMSTKILMRNLTSLGLVVDEIGRAKSTEAVAQMMRGKRATANVVMEMYEGQERNKIKYFKRMAPGAPGVGAVPFTAAPMPPVLQAPPAPPIVPAPPAPVDPIAMSPDIPF